MRAYIAVTDLDSYRLLRDRPDLDEVNFWQPGGHRLFRTLRPGEPFLFKLHHPENKIVGGGMFAHSSILDSRLAWDVFGEKNGARSHDEMHRRIERYRKGRTTTNEQYQIGCILLANPFFFPEEDWIPPPGDLKAERVQGKSYGLESPEGHALWQEVVSRLPATLGQRVPEPAQPGEWTEAGVRRRLGHGTFKVMVADAYERRCAVTRQKVLPVLEAAHIQPISKGGTHRIENGLLLRSDIRTLFDLGYVTVTPDHLFLVSRKLKAEFHNAEPYLQMNRTPVWLPQDSRDRPSRRLLQWHADMIFNG
jgi:putative restriction endonuclease